jgi:hypothetical protein
MSNVHFMREFQEFGNNVYKLVILMALSIPFPFLIIGILILMGKFLKNIKNANRLLNNNKLLYFYIKYKNSSIFRLVGLTFSAGSIAAFVFSFIPPFIFNPWIILIILISSLMILFAGSLSEVKAWEHLRDFFEENNKLFSQVVLNDIVEGCIKLRKGSLFYGLWFLIIPIFIGYGYQVSGFIKLSILKNIQITL